MTPCRILLVEDDPAAAELVSRKVGSAGHSVDVSDSAEKALARWKPGSHDVLLVDCKLPQMNGIEFIRRIRKIDECVGVIILTGSVTEAIEDACEGLGVWAIVSKAASSEVFDEKIANACELATMPESKKDFITAAIDHETGRMREHRHTLGVDTRRVGPEEMKTLMKKYSRVDG